MLFAKNIQNQSHCLKMLLKPMKCVKYTIHSNLKIIRNIEEILNLFKKIFQNE